MKVLGGEVWKQWKTNKQTTQINKKPRRAKKLISACESCCCGDKKTYWFEIVSQTEIRRKKRKEKTKMSWRHGKGYSMMMGPKAKKRKKKTSSEGRGLWRPCTREAGLCRPGAPKWKDQSRPTECSPTWASLYSQQVCIHYPDTVSPRTVAQGKQESSFTVAPCRVNLHSAWRLWSVCTVGNASMEAAPRVAQHLAAPSAVRRLARSKTSVLKFAGNPAPQPLPALDLLQSQSAW